MHAFRLTTAATIALLAAFPGAGSAGVYTHVDPVSGMVVLSNIAPQGRLTATNPANRKSGERSPGTFPQISAERQSVMDGGRRAILQDELGAEQRALAAASAARAAGEVLRRHASNIAALQRELAALSGKPNN